MGKKRRILLVDDEADNNRIFTIALRDAAFEVDAFVDPRLALSEFRPNYYDLVMLDIRMPMMYGDELYRQLRKIHSNGISYIAKPISVDELVAK